MNAKRQRLLIGVVGGIVVLGAWYKVVWSGQSAAIVAAEAKRTTAQAESNKTKAEANRLSTLKTDPVRLKLEQKLDGAVPEKADLPTYMRWINATAAEHNLVVPTISHSVPAPAVADAGQAASPDLFQVTLGLQATGSYEDILTFVHVLETTDRLIVVDTLNLAGDTTVQAVATATEGSAAAPSGPPKMTATIGARMYTRQAPPLAAAQPGAAQPAAAAPTTTTAAPAPGGATS